MDKTVSTYNTIAQQFADTRIPEFYRDEFNYFQQKLSKGKIIDIGCGEGTLIDYLIKEKNIELIFSENPTKRYISLLADKKSFCQICGLKSGLKIWVNLEMSELSEEESLKVRDVSKIGHWGMGDIECFIENDSEIDWIVSLVHKSYKKLTHIGVHVFAH